MAKFTDYFNSTTVRGRANVAKATYASFAALYLLNKFRKKGHRAEAKVELDEHRHMPSLENSHPHEPDHQTEADVTCRCGCAQHGQSSSGDHHFRQGSTDNYGASVTSKHHQTPNSPLGGDQIKVPSHSHHDYSDHQINFDRSGVAAVKHLSNNANKMLSTETDPISETSRSKPSLLSALEDNFITWGMP